LAARLGGAKSSAGPKPKVAVVGAGAFGGWTALHLRNQGAEVTLIDAWGAGNARSSSGGETRVIRAIYGPDRIYTELVKRAFELWETLESPDCDPLYVETGAVWLHRIEDAYVRSAVPILGELGFPVEQIALAAAAKRWPQIDLRGIKSVWLEKRAGALSAARGCIAVRQAFEKAGGQVVIAQASPGAIASEKMSALRLDDGSRVEADVYIFACGPWLGKLFPDVIGDRVHPSRQEVYYFGTPHGSRRYLPAHLPIWIDFGKRIFYGIPDAHGRGFKVADDTRGETFDPTNGDRTPSAEGIARARRLLALRFPELAKAPLLEAQVCQYENSPDGHLILDRHPAAANAWLLGGGSGHGFKLSPAVGEMACEAVLSGREVPALFRLGRLRDVAKPKTQFERKS
jgi:glycine/D-amino acid oxidase-like deaminating enzyme